MVTRRAIAFGLVSVLGAGSAQAQSVLISVRQRQSILDAKALAGVDAARFAEFAPHFVRCAQTYTTSDPPRARGLNDAAAEFNAASVALSAGANAIPDDLHAMPPLSRRIFRPFGAPRMTGNTQTPARTPQQSSNNAPIVVPNLRGGQPALQRSPMAEAIVLTPETLVSEAGGSAEAWRNIATALREIVTRTGIGLNPAADQFDQASQHLFGVRQALLAARIGDLESNDRLGNFDLLSTVNQSSNLASSVLKKLDDVRSGLAGRI